jgi:hypothetical protein
MSLGGSKLLPFNNDEGQWFTAAEMFWYLSLDLYLDSVLSRGYMDKSFDLMAWFLLLHALSNGTLYRQECTFPNHVQSIEFTTGGLQ